MGARIIDQVDALWRDPTSGLAHGHFNGPANRDGAMRNRTLNKGEVLVIRYEGPRGGPGMCAMPVRTAALYGQRGMGAKWPLTAEGRFSGATRGVCIGHAGPKARIEGSNPVLRDGDIFSVDAEAGTLAVTASKADSSRRKKDWKPRNHNGGSDALRSYARQAGSAGSGAVTHPGGSQKGVSHADI